MVLLCIQMAPSRIAGRNSAATASTASASNNIVSTTSASRTAAAGSDAASAPASASGFVFSALRFHTVTRIPDRSSERAMAAPIVPVPSTATCSASAAVFDDSLFGESDMVSLDPWSSSACHLYRPPHEEPAHGFARRLDALLPAVVDLHAHVLRAARRAAKRRPTR